MLFLVAFIVQMYFMPQWEDGNTHRVSDAEQGVHEQKNKSDDTKGLPLSINTISKTRGLYEF